MSVCPSQTLPPVGIGIIEPALSAANASPG